MASGIYIVVDFSGTSTCSSLRVAWAVSIFLNENACSILGSKGLITICQLLFSSVQGWQRASKYFETGWAYRDSSACTCTRTCAGTFTGTCMRGWRLMLVRCQTGSCRAPRISQNQWLLLTFHKSWHRRKIFDFPVHTGNYWRLLEVTKVEGWFGWCDWRSRCRWLAIGVSRRSSMF